MNQRIVYQLPEQPVAILIPAIPQYIAQGVEAPIQLDILQIGQKDVPAGIPFWIVDAADIPEDRAYRDAWTLEAGDMGAPDGFGGTYQPALSAAEGASR